METKKNYSDFALDAKKYYFLSSWMFGVVLLATVSSTLAYVFKVFPWQYPLFGGGIALIIVYFISIFMRVPDLDTQRTKTKTVVYLKMQIAGKERLRNRIQNRPSKFSASQKHKEMLCVNAELENLEQVLQTIS